MADQDDKSLDPTPHRREQARRGGQAPHSHDLGTAALLVAATLALVLGGKGLVDFCGGLLDRHLGGEAWLCADRDFLLDQCREAVGGAAVALLPLWGTVLVVAIGVQVAQVGWVFLPQRLVPDLARLSPAAGIRRIFSPLSLVRCGQGMIQLFVVGGLGGWALYRQAAAIARLPARTVWEITFFVGELLLQTALEIGAALVTLAVLDYLWQRWRHERSLRMTRQELREELRQIEGDPQLASRRRAAQRELALGREAVSRASVVLVAPEGIAVALRYDPNSPSAPWVVAKGSGALAARIRQTADVHSVPIVERPQLARTLYQQLEIARPVSSTHYGALAELLAAVGGHGS